MHRVPFGHCLSPAGRVDPILRNPSSVRPVQRQKRQPVIRTRCLWRLWHSRRRRNHCHRHCRRRQWFRRCRRARGNSSQFPRSAQRRRQARCPSRPSTGRRRRSPAVRPMACRAAWSRRTQVLLLGRAVWQFRWRGCLRRRRSMAGRLGWSRLTCWRCSQVRFSFVPIQSVFEPHSNWLGSSSFGHA